MLLFLIVQGIIGWFSGKILDKANKPIINKLKEADISKTYQEIDQRRQDRLKNNYQETLKNIERLNKLLNKENKIDKKQT